MRRCRDPVSTYDPNVPASSPVTTSGRVSAVNLITATRLRRVPLQRLGFTLSKAPDWFAQKFGEQGLERQFKTFNFLHRRALGEPRAFPAGRRRPAPGTFEPELGAVHGQLRRRVGAVLRRIHGSVGRGRLRRLGTVHRLSGFPRSGNGERSPRLAGHSVAGHTALLRRLSPRHDQRRAVRGARAPRNCAASPSTSRREAVRPSDGRGHPGLRRCDAPRAALPRTG